MRKRGKGNDEPSKKLMEVLAASVRLNTTNTKEIAAYLKKPVQTVRTYWTRLLARTGTNSRPEAQLKAIRRGWLTLDIEIETGEVDDGDGEGGVEEERPAA
jgi:DNA-binding CsgD family transcriptional regulator